MSFGGLLEALSDGARGAQGLVRALVERRDAGYERAGRIEKAGYVGPMSISRDWEEVGWARLKASFSNEGLGSSCEKLEPRLSTKGVQDRAGRLKKISRMAAPGLHLCMCLLQFPSTAFKSVCRPYIVLLSLVSAALFPSRKGVGRGLGLEVFAPPLQPT
ncbi:hypothetical protein K402DRAFT_52490 [Aulographum hederae CBS 113979]|uniref:Uncharacterized protein n=1 Tax=Aulographum hederae CBS 113979 TaxID=1176131 RepID=A0A6G1H1R2_9PEZI|nr:hypothetical protein K402DRAFT_52490 [Aulographum hederae CBS 113979]